MVIAIGCDVVEHHLTRTLGWVTSTRARERVFSVLELDLCGERQLDLFMSGRFAGKEAILKCLGVGIRDGVALTDLEILQDELGKPIVSIKGDALIIAQKLGIVSWHISISHSSSFSTAFVIAEGIGLLSM